MKIFLSTHGKMASGMKTSLEILLGKADCVTVYDAYLPGDTTTVAEHIEAFLEKTSEDEMKLLISDIYGGSVNQQMVQFLDRKNTYVISGVNLGLLLSLAASATDDTLTIQDVDHMVEESREMTKRVTMEFEVNQDEFF
jgi:mannose/fructose-specific phosphotransferase system component IIA